MLCGKTLLLKCFSISRIDKNAAIAGNPTTQVIIYYWPLNDKLCFFCGGIKSLLSGSSWHLQIGSEAAKILTSQCPVVYWHPVGIQLIGHVSKTSSPLTVFGLLRIASHDGRRKETYSSEVSEGRKSAEKREGRERKEKESGESQNTTSLLFIEQPAHPRTSVTKSSRRKRVRRAVKIC